jgi:hypothetical protein
MQTPGTIDQYSRFMVDMFDEKQIIAVSTVWQTFFGRPEHGSRTVYSPDSEVVDIDIMRGNRRIAALVQRGTNSRNLNAKKNTVTQAYTTFSRVAPLAEELGAITATQINKRVAGENPYERISRQERTRALAREHHLEHIRRYVRLFEALAGSSLLGGQMPTILGTTNTDLLFDWCRNTAHFATPAIPWDAAGATILADIDHGCDTVFINGKVKANVMFMADDVATVFFTSVIIAALAEIRGYTFVRAGENNVCPPQLMPLKDGGASYRGYMQTPKGNELHLFTYMGVYDDADGNHQKYMPDGTIFIAHYGARCDRYFGPPEVLPQLSSDIAFYQEMFGMNMMAPSMPANIGNAGAIVNPNMFYSDAYRTDDKKKVLVRTQSSPIFATTQTDAFFTYTDVLEVSS